MKLFCIHKYTKWGQPFNVKSGYFRQMRVCTSCGKAGIRKIGGLYSHSPSLITNSWWELTK